jgi:DNA repair exonuclease SbcCD ATPase subunit
LIVFKVIRYKNFLSTGNIFTEIYLNKDNSTLIIGENGSGKSTLLDSLSFVLFGKSYRNINKPQLVNTITSKNMVVELEFSTTTDEYKIIRGIKPVIFEIYCNGELINQNSALKDYQEVLEKQILKINHKSFCQVVVLGNATFQPFMQLTPARRREIVEDILDLQVFTKMNVILKQDIQRNVEDIAEVLSTKKFTEEKIKFIKDQYKDQSNDIERLIQDKEDRKVNSLSEMNILKSEIIELQSSVNSLEESNLDTLSLDRKIDKIVSLRHRIEANRDSLKKEIQFLDHNDSCPTCKQNIEEKFKCDTIEDKTTKIAEIENGLLNLLTQYNTLKTEQESINTALNKLNQLKIQITRREMGISSHQIYIKEVDEEIKQIRENKNTDIIDKLKILDSELKDIESTYNELMEQKEINSVLGSLLKDTGIKSKIIKQYISIINKLINKFLIALDLMVQFELDENFNEIIKSRYRDEFSYFSFSEGEKQKIDVALLFTWRAVAKMRNSAATNLLIMDEIFDSSLDSVAVDNLMDIIKQISTENNIFVISHKEVMVDKFKNIIKFVKQKNFSKIT